MLPMSRPAAPPPAEPRTHLLWDVFCQVIDNYGDVGVLWRLCAALAARGERVRLWVDDTSALAWMAPGATEGRWPGVQLRAWSEAEDPANCAALDRADVWIEGFGCEIPAGFVAHFAGRVQAAPGARPPVWINLEYLSAQAYVERNHGLPSPLLHGPARGWTKIFYYPGFTAGSGGLLRNALATESLVPDGGDSQPPERARCVSLFCYEPGALAALIKGLGEDPRAARLVVTHGRAAAAMRRLLAQPGFKVPGNVGLEFLPALSQPEFDALLGRCDLNLVRGEDSLVQALWAGKPFIWQAYPQTDDAHRDKLDAFLDWFQADADVRDLHHAWNGFSKPPDAARWAQTLADRDGRWARQVQAARQRLLVQEDLATQLRRLVAKSR